MPSSKINQRVQYSVFFSNYQHLLFSLIMSSSSFLRLTVGKISGLLHNHYAITLPIPGRVWLTYGPLWLNENGCYEIKIVVTPLSNRYHCWMDGILELLLRYWVTTVSFVDIYRALVSVVNWKANKYIPWSPWVYYCETPKNSTTEYRKKISEQEGRKLQQEWLKKQSNKTVKWIWKYKQINSIYCASLHSSLVQENVAHWNL
jgi:hypothetical protein